MAFVSQLVGHTALGEQLERAFRLLLFRTWGSQEPELAPEAYEYYRYR